MPIHLSINEQRELKRLLDELNRVYVNLDSFDDLYEAENTYITKAFDIVIYIGILYNYRFYDPSDIF